MKKMVYSCCNVTDELVALPFQENIPFGTNLIFAAGDYKFGIEICVRPLGSNSSKLLLISFRS